ncbi:S8 family serine peptidase [Paraferrimonas haliotis]|nr:S8 family serine peptidase [Paraferrimonas haliotis]
MSIKIKKATLLTLSALYVACSAGASGMNETQFRPIVITDEIKEFNKRNGEDRMSRNSLAQRDYSNGRNVHRGIATSPDTKVPFNYQNGLTGQHTYIVELADAPAATYQGGVAGLQATAPTANKHNLFSVGARNANKLDTNSGAVKNYVNYLTERQDNVLAQAAGIVGDKPVVKGRYNLAFNGMALTLTQEQAQRLAQQPGVRNVTLEQKYELHTDVGPQHIGADKFWTGEVTGGMEYKGEGVVVGVLDTGINTDHPAFAAVAEDGYTHVNPLGSGVYLGDCEKAEFASMCNDKLIGVRSYEVITDTYDHISFFPELPEWGWVEAPKRPANGEDYNGHGSHTASTAAGNAMSDVDYVVGELGEIGDGFATGLKFPKISGVAPRANVIMYQVCHPTDGTLGNEFRGCPGAALLSGIEDAIADGVDVINFSIGTAYGSFPWENPTEMAFLAAREAGISVAASAGNSYAPAYANQARGAIDHFSPWVTSVAATTHGRKISVVGKTLSEMSGGDMPAPATIEGAGITEGYSGPIVRAADYGDEQCLTPFPAGTFDADPMGMPFTKAPIVVCARGEIPRVEKATNVAAGGAGALVLYNVYWDDGIVNDVFEIPAIHIDASMTWSLNNWLSSGSDHMATITAAEVITEEGQADMVADFSSRGPNLELPDVMSPNLGAPGVDVYAAYADEMPFTAAPFPSDYVAISGTSMAAPHVAGAMALLKQANPSWTPAQIQSALMMTASIEGVTRTEDNAQWNAGIEAAQYSDVGSGVINVARAVKTGLLLDETADNYRAANPRNGGSVINLNLPYLYNASCDQSCTWMRTFTATQDGTWNVDGMAHAMEGAGMLDVEVMPKSFSLKAGETQNIVVKANILEINAPNADSSQLMLDGVVTITPTEGDMPVQHLPMSVRYKPNSLPESASAVIHRSNGHILTPELMTEEIQSLTTRVDGLVKGMRYDFNLDRGTTRINDGSNIADLEADTGTEVVYFEVPEGTARIVWEVASKEGNAFSGIQLGMDVNNDGEFQWGDEGLCYSYTNVNDYCAVNNPAPGMYWAILGNWKQEWEDPDNTMDPMSAALAIIPMQDSGMVTVEGPAQVQANTPYQLQLNYQLDDVMEGDVYYGLLHIGSNDYNDANIGSMAIRLDHQGSDVILMASQTAAKAGDVIDFNLDLKPNLAGGDRDYTMTVNLPEHYTLQEDSIRLGGFGVSMDDVTIDGQTVTIAATQPSSAGMKREYVFTTNFTDDQCKVPYGDDPSFFDLAVNHEPAAIWGYPNETVQVPLSANGLPHVPLYGNPEMYGRDVLTISPFGFVQFDELPLFFSQHFEFNDNFQFFPDTVVAPMWKSDVMMPEPMFDWGEGRFTSGVYPIITDKHYIIQWDGGVEYANWFVGANNPDPDAEYSVQTVISTELNFEPNDYELVYAYRSFKTANPDIGSVGVHGFYGPSGTYGPLLGYLNDGVAYNNLGDVIQEGMVICGDYHGPEQSQVNLDFSVVVGAAATGTIQDLTVDSQYSDSEMTTVAHSMKVPANITVAAINDHMIDENQMLENITVYYNDLKGTANGIVVSGDNITAEVMGTESGSTFSITPDQDWHGMTEVTVMVHDMANPNDAHSVTFMLEVVSDGVEPTPPAAPEPEPEVEDEEDDSDGGSLGYFALMLLALAGMRRRMK